MLVRDSNNFKIRIQAAAALSALPDRAAYGASYNDILVVLASALEAQDGGDGGAVGNTPLPLPLLPTPSSGGAVGGDDDADGKFPNYKYAASLSAQLRSTLFHLLSVATPPAGSASSPRSGMMVGSGPLGEPLSRRLDWVWRLLKADVEAAVQRRHACEMEHASLPADPFGSGGGGTVDDSSAISGSRGAKSRSSGTLASTWSPVETGESVPPAVVAVSVPEATSTGVGSDGSSDLGMPNLHAAVGGLLHLLSCVSGPQISQAKTLTKELKTRQAQWWPGALS